MVASKPARAWRIRRAEQQRWVFLCYGRFDPVSIRLQFEVNALAPLLLTQALVHQMPSGAKLALMTSRMGSIEDNSSGGSYGYRMSKVALNIAGKSLAIDLAPRGIAVAILHPGLVRTRMINFNPNGISPHQAVEGLLARIDALNIETSGKKYMRLTKPDDPEGVAIYEPMSSSDESAH